MMFSLQSDYHAHCSLFIVAIQLGPTSGSQQDEMSSRSGASGSNRSSSSRQGFLSKRSGGSQSQQSQSQRSQLQLQLQTQTSQGSGLSRASSGISGAGSGISGLVSEGEQSEQSGVPSKTKDD